MSLIFPSFKTAIISFAVGASLVLPAAYFVHRYDTDATQVKLDVQKQKADDLLLSETNKTRAAEARLAALGQQIEVTHNAAQQVLDTNARLNADLIAARGLFDPGRRPSGAGPVPGPQASGPAGVHACPADDGRLSEGTSRFLLGLTDRANRAAQYARDARQFGLEVTGAASAVSPASTAAK